MERIIEVIRELQEILNKNSLTAQQDKELRAELYILENIRKETQEKICKAAQETSYGSYFAVD